MRAKRSKIFPRQTARVVCLLLLGGVLLTPLHAQPKRIRPQTQYLRIGQPDQEEGRQILEDFRQRGIEGDYYWEFELSVLPREGGVSKRIPGRLWGSRNDKGAVSRIVLWPGDAAERRMIVEIGPQSACWLWRADDPLNEVRPVTGSAWFEPLADTHVSLFDLQMPFIHWTDFQFEGVVRRSNRPAHVFVFYPPADLAAQQPQLAGVRVYLDTAYHALVQFELIGADDKPLKTLRLGSFIQVDNRWIVKEGDFRDDTTRDKTRFEVTAAAMGLQLSPSLFEAETLKKAQPAPAQGLRSFAR